MRRPPLRWLAYPIIVLMSWAVLSGCGDDGTVADTPIETHDDGGGSEAADADVPAEADAAADADSSAEADAAADADADAEADADAADDDGSADGSTLPCPPDVAGVVVNVTVDQLHDRIVAGDTLAVVDVREPTETASGIIEGALLYPYGTGVLAAEHSTLPADRPLYVICASGGRSALASAFLVDSGHSCVDNVLGGMSAWRSAGYPTVTP